MREMFLLGAGASVEAGVPDSFEMTKVMVDKFAEDHYAQKHIQILRFVIGGLLFHKGRKGENPFEGINIEDLFSTVQQLAKRRDSELDSFISSWHPILDEFESGDVSNYDVQQMLQMLYRPLVNIFENNPFSPDLLTTKNFGSKISQSLFFLQADFELQDQIVKVVKQIVNSRGGEAFYQTNIFMIQKLIEMVWIEDVSRVKYLTPLVSSSVQNETVIATLNYDNAVELAAAACTIPVDSGFDAWSKTEVFDFQASNIPLIKLHGSIDWALSERTSIDKPSPHQVIQKIVRAKKEGAAYEPAIIFGGKNKLTAKGPFLSLLTAFDQNLIRSHRLTTIGYSFRDEHINEYIGKWVNRDTQNILRIINPDHSIINNSFLSEIMMHNSKRIELITEVASKGIELVCQVSNT